MVSKKRMSEVERVTKELLGDNETSTQLLEAIKQILEYDGKSSYTEYNKQYYEQHKQALNQKRSEARRARKH